MIPSHPADLQLVRDALARDARALAELGRRLAVVDRLCRARNMKAGGPLRAEDVADLAQDVRTKAWERLPDYAGCGALESWLFGFVEFHMRNAVRKLRSRPAAGPLAEDPAAPPPVFHDDVYSCLDKLAAVDQHIVRLKYFEGLTLAAIAQRLGLNVNTVKSRYVRALEQLHGCLGAQRGAEGEA